MLRKSVICRATSSCRFFYVPLYLPILFYNEKEMAPKKTKKANCLGQIFVTHGWSLAYWLLFHFTSSPLLLLLPFFLSLYLSPSLFFSFPLPFFLFLFASIFVLLSIPFFLFFFASFFAFLSILPFSFVSASLFAFISFSFFDKGLIV